MEAELARITNPKFPKGMNALQFLDHFGIGNTLPSGEVECLFCGRSGKDYFDVEMHDGFCVASFLIGAAVQLENEEFWNKWVFPEGASPDDIKVELADYRQILKNLGSLLDYFTMGRMSKPTYTLNSMISEIEEVQNEFMDDFFAEEIEVRLNRIISKEDILEVADHLKMHDYAQIAEVWRSPRSAQLHSRLIELSKLFGEN